MYRESVKELYRKKNVKAEKIKPRKKKKEKTFIVSFRDILDI